MKIYSKIVTVIIINIIACWLLSFIGVNEKSVATMLLGVTTGIASMISLDIIELIYNE